MVSHRVALSLDERAPCYEWRARETLVVGGPGHATWLGERRGDVGVLGGPRDVAGRGGHRPTCVTAVIGMSEHGTAAQLVAKLILNRVHFVLQAHVCKVFSISECRGVVETKTAGSSVGHILDAS